MAKPSVNAARWRELALAVYTRDRWRCQYCGRDVLDGSLGADMPTVDHIVARSAGGEDCVPNLRTCCHRCNTTKGASDIELFRQRLAFQTSRYAGVITHAQYRRLVNMGVELEPLEVRTFHFEQPDPQRYPPK